MHIIYLLLLVVNVRIAVRGSLTATILVIDRLLENGKILFKAFMHNPFPVRSDHVRGLAKNENGIICSYLKAFIHNLFPVRVDHRKKTQSLEKNDWLRPKVRPWK
jgi:hypothetical protein